MSTKAELEELVAILREQLAAERSRPTGHRFEDVHIDMSKPDEVGLAIANAVREGMTALQNLRSEKSIGLYVAAPAPQTQD